MLLRRGMGAIVGAFGCCCLGLLEENKHMKVRDFFLILFKFLRLGNFNYVYFIFRGDVVDCRW